MSNPFLGELRIFSFNFAPKGWAQANGQLMPINQNQALFSLFGTFYGGDGRVNFALPNLKGSVPIHQGAGYNMGQAAGEVAHTLSLAEMPAHNHFAMDYNGSAPASQDGVEVGPTKSLAQALVSLPNNQTTPGNIYGTGAPVGTMGPSTISNTGGSQPHENMMPYLTLNICVALQGIFPSQN